MGQRSFCAPTWKLACPCSKHTLEKVENFANFLFSSAIFPFPSFGKFLRQSKTRSPLPLPSFDLNLIPLNKCSHEKIRNRRHFSQHKKHYASHLKTRGVSEKQCLWCVSVYTHTDGWFQ